MNFHYDDSFNHIMSGKAASHCLLKNTHILHAEHEACASGFLSLCSYSKRKNCHFFLFQKLREPHGKGTWALPPAHPPLGSGVFGSTVQWAVMSRRSVCNISGFTTPPLLPWKPDSSISPLSRSCSSLARC